MTANAVLFTTAYFVIRGVIVMAIERALVHADLTADTALRVSLHDKFIRYICFHILTPLDFLTPLDSYRYSLFYQVLFGFADRIGPVMKYTGRQDSVGFTGDQGLIQVFRRTGTTAGNHGYGDCPGYRPQQLQVVASLSTIGVDTINYYLAHPQLNRLKRPGQRIETGRPSAIGTSMGEHLPTGWIYPGDTLGVHTQNNTLAAEALGCPGNEARVKNRRRVDRDFIGARFQHPPDVLHATQPATHG